MTTFETTERTVRSADGTAIVMETCGTGPAVVVVDGACCHRAFGPLRSLAQHLAADFTVHGYDRRGRGASTDTLPYAIEREVEDLAAVLAAVETPACVYGVSSGALLAMRGVGAGLPITRLALFEPPIGTGEAVAPSLASDIAALVAVGRRGDAVERFQTGIGVPAETIAGMRRSPAWSALELIAPTLVYDCMIADATTLALASHVGVPTLVIDSETAGDARRALADALPNGHHRRLPGQWHTVADEVLAPALAGFFANGDEDEPSADPLHGLLAGRLDG